MFFFDKTKVDLKVSIFDHFTHNFMFFALNTMYTDRLQEKIIKFGL